MKLYNRGSSYYTIITIPRCLISEYGKKQIWRSLKTKDYKLAKLRAEFETIVRSHNMDKVSVRLTTITPHFFDDDDRNIIATINQYYKNAIKDIQNLVLVVPSEFQNVKPYTLKFKYRKYNKPSFLGCKNGTLNISFNIDLKNTSILCDTFIGKTKKNRINIRFANCKRTYYH